MIPQLYVFDNESLFLKWKKKPDISTYILLLKVDKKFLNMTLFV